VGLFVFELTHPYLLRQVTLPSTSSGHRLGSLRASEAMPQVYSTGTPTSSAQASQGGDFGLNDANFLQMPTLKLKLDAALAL